MKYIFKYEYERIKNNKRFIFFIILFLILSLVFVFKGIIIYKSKETEIKNFKEYQILKINGYLNYDQYGGYGFGLIFRPSPLVIFFNSTPETLESNIDTKEIIDIKSSKRGEVKTGYLFFGFSSFVFFWGALLQIYFGLKTFNSRKNIQIHRKFKTITITIFIRLFFSILFFLTLYSLAFAIANVFLFFSTNELNIYMNFVLYSLILMASFYILGLIPLFIMKKSKHILKTAILLWVGFVLMPEISYIFPISMPYKMKSIYKINIEKMKSAKKWEIKANEDFKKMLSDKNLNRVEIYKRILPEYLNSIYKNNMKLEEELIENEKELFKSTENISLYFPTLYYHFFIVELGDGYYSYLNFLSQIVKEKEQFLKWYIKKKFYERSGIVEPFKEHTVFFSKPILPNSFSLAVKILTFYTFILIFFLYVIFKKHFSYKLKNSINLDLEPGVHFKLNATKQEIGIYRSNEIFLENITLNDIYPNVTIKNVFMYLVFIRKVKLKNALINLKHFDVYYNLKNKITNIEEMKSIYASVVFADDINTIIINDYLKGVSEIFDFQFRGLLQFLSSLGKTSLYLGTKPFETELRKEFFKKIQEKDIIPIDVSSVSFR